MAFLSFLDTNLAFFALGAYNLKFSGYAYEVYLIIISIVFFFFFFEKNVNFTSFHLKITPAIKSQRNSVVNLSYEWQT